MTAQLYVCQTTALLAELHGANALEFSRAAVDDSHIRALKGGQNRTKPRRPGQGGQ